MTIQIELKPEVQAGLAAQARVKGVALQQYVESLLEQMARPSYPLETAMSADQRARLFRQWAENFPSRRNTPLPDEALTRDNLYRQNSD